MKDLFSKHASAYAAFRPTYPKELYDFILSLVNSRTLAWDCATGNGQVAQDLAPHFEKVIATDISARQIDNALRADNIEYIVSSAEKTNFTDSSFDLITVGQAVHWFDVKQFNKEVVRVAKPGAILAVWGYSLFRINPGIDKIISDFYVNVIGPYWDPERKLVDNHYSDISFPFQEITTPEFRFSFLWTIEELHGYISTWSSVQKYIRVNGKDPVEPLIDQVRTLWIAEKLRISFPLFLKCGRQSKVAG